MHTNFQEWTEERFAEQKIDALLVFALPNVRYLSGFTGSNGLLLVTAGGNTLFTDPRYTLQAASETSGCKVKTARGPLVSEAAKLIAQRRLKRIGFERGRVMFDSWQRLKESLPLGVSLKPVGPAIEELRMVKSPEEIQRIRGAVATNSLAFEAVLPGIRPGVPEMEIAAELEYQMRRHGAEKASFSRLFSD